MKTENRSRPALNTLVDYYLNDSDTNLNRYWMVFAPDQMKHLAEKICHIYNRLDTLTTTQRGDVLRFIHATMVRGTDVTHNHFETMVAISRSGKKNPIRLELGQQSGRQGNQRQKVNDYERYVTATIARNGYKWTYEEMVGAARALQAGKPVDSMDYHKMLTQDDYANIQGLMDEMAARYFRNLEDQKAQYQELVDGLVVNFEKTITDLTDKVDGLEAELRKVNMPKPTVVVDNTKKPITGMNTELADKIKERLNPTNKEAH